MNAPHACRRRSSFDHITWHSAQEQRKGSRKEINRNICPTDLSPSPHWHASPLDNALSLIQASIFSACPPKHSLAQSFPYLCVRSRGCVPLILLQPLGLCCPTAFPGSKVKVLAGGQGFYLLPLWCSFPSAPESLLHPEKDSIMLNKNPEIN